MVVGIHNSGNNCFAIASIQLLARAFNPDLIEEIKNPFTLSSVWKDMVKKLITPTNVYSYLNINHFLNVLITNSNGLFQLGRQEDSNEFILYFLDKLSSDTKNITQLPTRKYYNMLVSTIQDNQITNKTRIGETLTKFIKAFDNYESAGWCNRFNWIGCSVVMEKNSSYSTTIEYLTSLFIPITSNQLLDCINIELRGEILENDKLRKLFIWHFPEYLLISLKRFNQNGTKNLDMVYCPLLMDLTHLEFNNTPAKYMLVGYVSHQGSVNQGHYYTVVIENNKIWRLDDDNVCEINNIDDSGAYIIMYKRI